MLRVLFSISTILIAAWPSWSKAQNAKESTIVIKRTIKLAAAPSRLSLSPDGNRLAVHEFNNALVRIVDINTDSGPGTVVSTKVRPEVDIVWSEDSKRIAISSPDILSIIDTATGAVISAIASPIANCSTITIARPPNHRMAFTPDGQKLWVGCYNGSVVGPYTAALLLDASSLKPEKTIILESPTPNDKTSITLEISSRAGELFLGYSALSYAGINSKTSVYLGGYNLSSGVEEYPPVKVYEDSPGRNANRVLKFGDLAIVQWSARGDFIETFRLPFKSEKRFGAPPDRPQIGASSILTSPDGRTVYAPDKKTGIVRVWNSETGSELRSIPTAGLTFYDISADGLTLALSSGTSLSIYEMKN